MGIWTLQCTPTGLDNSTELRMEKIHQAVTEIWVPQVWQPPAWPPAHPPARPPGPWRQYPSSPEGWGVKKTVQPGNQPGEVSNKIYICSSKKIAVLWNSCFVKQSSDLKSSSIPLWCHWKPKCQRRLSLSLVIPFVQHVHLHQYSWFGQIHSAVANQYRNSASLLKRSVSITSIS